jgi:heme-degrading monooxygenase HmoA
VTITRVWHGRTRLEDADTYLAYITRTGIAGYTSTPGNLSAKILRRTEGEICHFITLSEWDSYDSIRKFAGEDFEMAKYYDEDKKYLLEFEEKVIHYETYS